MIFPSEIAWSRWGIDDSLFQHFVIQWYELFSDLSPDSWQVRTCNCRTLLDEISEAARLCDSVESARFSVAILIAELKHSITADPVISKEFPAVADFVRSLPTGEIKTEQIDSIKSQINIIKSYLGSYRDKLIQNLRSCFVHSDKERAKEKSELSLLTAALATELASEGYSLDFLRSTFDALVVKTTDNLLDRFDAFISTFSPEPKKFVCKLGASLPTYMKPEALTTMGIQLIPGLSPQPWADSERRFYKNSTNDDVFALVTVSALDPYRAAQIADERLANIFAVRQLYQPAKTLQRKGPTILAKLLEGTEWTEIRPRRPRLETSYRAEEEIAKFFELQSRVSTEDGDQIAAAAQYHRLALMASTDEGRLVNLWIALESLTNIGSSNSIIECVCTHVGPSVACENLSRIVESLKIYLQYFWERAPSLHPLEVFSRSSQTMLHLEDVLDALLEPKDGPKSAHIYDLVKNHPLILYRFFQLRHTTFLSATGALTAIKRHRSNVDWQLRRIYRSRNSVAHRGQTAPIIRFLIQHLHTYFTMTAHNLISDLQENKDWTLVEALTFRRLLFDQFVRALERYDKQKIAREALISPKLMLKSNLNSVIAWA